VSSPSFVTDGLARDIFIVCFNVTCIINYPGGTGLLCLIVLDFVETAFLLFIRFKQNVIIMGAVKKSFCITYLAP
jgi:hypothetical protein